MRRSNLVNVDFTWAAFQQRANETSKSFDAVHSWLIHWFLSKSIIGNQADWNATKSSGWASSGNCGPVASMLPPWTSQLRTLFPLEILGVLYRFRWTRSPRARAVMLILNTLTRPIDIETRGLTNFPPSIIYTKRQAFNLTTFMVQTLSYFNYKLKDKHWRPSWVTVLILIFLISRTVWF